jgi:hypothetical protein
MMTCCTRCHASQSNDMALLDQSWIYMTNTYMSPLIAQMTPLQGALCSWKNEEEGIPIAM